MKILVVDDEALVLKGIQFNLKRDGYTVITGCDGEQAVALAKREQPDLIILDLMMPIKDGLEACVEIRAFSDVPIIILTARSEDMDKLMGFDCGADDYVTKPFNILELKARIRALLRRSGSRSGTVHSETAPLCCGPITLNPISRSATVNNTPVTLTAREFDLMELLLRNPNRVFSRNNLLDQVWGYEYQGDDRTVDVHIRRLREKLEPNPAMPVYIMTKWGVGYYLRDEISETEAK